jgi:catalase-peroxidase
MAKASVFSAGANAPKQSGETKTNRDWWPNQLKLNILRQNSLESNQWELI